MNTFFQDMLPFEIIMLMVGVLLALACITAIFKMIIKGGKLSLQLPVFLVISIAMMGFSKIQSINYGKLKIEVNTLSQKVEKNPADTLARRQLQEKTTQLTTDTRYRKDTEGHNYSAEAYYTLGNYTLAKNAGDAVDKINPSKANPQLIAKINNKLAEQNLFNNQVRKISNLLVHYNLSKDKSVISDQVASALVATPKVTYTDAKAAQVIAGALEVTGDNYSAKRVSKLAASPIYEKIDHPSVMIKDLSVPNVKTDSTTVRKAAGAVQNWSKTFHPHVLSAVKNR